MLPDQYQSLFALTYQQFITQLDVQPDQIVEDVRYEKLIPVNRILVNEQYFFFQDDDLKLVYISDDALIKAIWVDFKATHGTITPAATLRSRAGKTSNQLVFPEQGITVSITGGKVDFVEIYPPQTLDEYMENIYREPGKFIR